MSDHTLSRHRIEDLKVNDLILTSMGHCMILAKGPVKPEGPGYFAGATILHTNPGNDFLPFAVHELWYDDERDLWMMSSGDYCSTLNGAMNWFQDRAGKRG